MLQAEDLIICSFFGSFFITFNFSLVQFISKIYAQSFPSYGFHLTGLISSLLTNTLLYTVYNNPWLSDYISINIFIGIFYWLCTISYFLMIFPTVLSVKINVIKYSTIVLIGLISILQLVSISYYILYQTTTMADLNALNELEVDSDPNNYYYLLLSLDWAHLVSFKLLELFIKISIYWKFNNLMDGNYNLIKSQFVRLSRALFAIFFLDGILLILIQSYFTTYSWGLKCFILTFKLYGEYSCLIKLRKVYLIIRHRISFSNLMRSRNTTH